MCRMMESVMRTVLNIRFVLESEDDCSAWRDVECLLLSDLIAGRAILLTDWVTE